MIMLKGFIVHIVFRPIMGHVYKCPNYDCQREQHYEGPPGEGKPGVTLDCVTCGEELAKGDIIKEI